MIGLSDFESNRQGVEGELKKYVIDNEEVYSLCGETGITLYGSKQTLSSALPLEYLAEHLNPFDYSRD